MVDFSVVDLNTFSCGCLFRVGLGCHGVLVAGEGFLDYYHARPFRRSILPMHRHGVLPRLGIIPYSKISARHVLAMVDVVIADAAYYGLRPHGGSQSQPQLEQRVASSVYSQSIWSAVGFTFSAPLRGRAGKAGLALI